MRPIIQLLILFAVFSYLEDYEDYDQGPEHLSWRLDTPETEIIIDPYQHMGVTEDGDIDDEDW